jgi:hypothetical protein
LAYLVQRGAERAGDMARCEFLRRADIEHHHVARGQPLGQNFARDRLGPLDPAGDTIEDLVDTVDVLAGDLLDQRHQAQRVVVGQPINGGLALAPACHQPDTAQFLKVLRAVGKAQLGFLGQSVDAFLALGQLLQKAHPVRRGEGAGDRGIFVDQGEFVGR